MGGSLYSRTRLMPAFLSDNSTISFSLNRSRRYYGFRQNETIRADSGRTLTGHASRNSESVTSLPRIQLRNLRYGHQPPESLVCVRSSDSELTVLKWNLEAAPDAGARHFCGEDQPRYTLVSGLSLYVHRPKLDFTKSVSVKASSWLVGKQETHSALRRFPVCRKTARYPY